MTQAHGGGKKRRETIYFHFEEKGSKEQDLKRGWKQNIYCIAKVSKIPNGYLRRL